ncbi:MAG: hypothetical protein C7N36_21725 [Bacteroidetes bacterium]|nr:MAG: hypothetical protein C7N36_21725 [Bacteroidota bacterium]
MAKKVKRSFGEKLAAAQQSSFVGRKAQLDKFRENIDRGAEHDNFLNIFNIHGQGGAGKSTLLQEYARIAGESGYALASIDTEARRLYEVTATMSSLAEQLDQAGGDFAKFHKTYKTYLQEKGKLEADPESPRGTLGTLIGGGLHLGARVAREAVPGAGLFVTDELLKSTAKIGGEWADFAYRKLTNKDEVKLVLEPLEVLTPLWVAAFNDLLEKKHVLLSFDTYETANSELDQWLVRLLKDEFGELEDTNFLVVIAGRSPLDGSSWHNFASVTLSFLLDRFTEEEATSYLQKRGITNQAVITEILAISNCLPVYLALLGDTGSNEESGVVQDPNDKVVARFLKHISDPVLKLLATRAALPRRLNQDIVATLLADQPTLAHTPQVLFDWLTSRPFIQKRGDHWAYHPIVRESIQRYLRERSLAEWETLHQGLASFYHDKLAKLGLEAEAHQFADEDWRLGRTEEVYHLLCQNYKGHIKLAGEFIVTTLRLVGPGAANLVVEAVVEREKNGNILEGWGTVFKQSFVAMEKGGFQDALSYFIQINTEDFFNDHIVNTAFIWFLQGYCYGEIRLYDQAIQALTKAIELQPDYADAYFNMGITYHEQENYEQAIQAYTKAIELQPDDPAAYNNLGLTFRKQENYEQAIQALTKVIELQPNYADAYYYLGKANDELENYEQAIQAYTKAIELQPNDAYALHALGWTYILLNQIAAAEPYFQKAWEMTGEMQPTASMNLGHCALLTGDQQTAEAWYRRSIPLWEDAAEFWQGMANDFTELKMAERGISAVAYEEMVARLRGE